MQVTLTKITVNFGSLRAVDDVSLDFEEAEIHALVGENGAGKSTIMAVLFGLQTDHEGQIHIDSLRMRWQSPRQTIAAGSAWSTSISCSKTRVVVQSGPCSQQHHLGLTVGG